MLNLRPLAYAFFLACSWAWCIGLFLPLLLLRDFGFWSFLVFAVPNVLGAAAMGVMLWRPDASARFLAAHAPACRAFSIVTALFQAWFAFSILDRANLREASPAITLAVALVAGAALGILAARPRFAGRALASVLAFAATVAVVLWWLAKAGVSPTAPLPAPTESSLDLLCLAPVCVLGFALSPYLDLTFHAARQSLPGPAGARAFLVGFLVLFPAFLVLALLYGRHALAANPADPLAALAPPVLAGILAQVVFTAALHLRASAPSSTRSMLLTTVAVLAVAIGLAELPPGWSYAGLSTFEITYRLFMAFYGLLFPAYVLLAAIGAHGLRGEPTTRTRITLALAVALAAPCYWMGFIERDTPWLAPGVLIVVLARAFIKA